MAGSLSLVEYRKGHFGGPFPLCYKLSYFSPSSSSSPFPSFTTFSLLYPLLHVFLLLYLSNTPLSFFPSTFFSIFTLISTSHLSLDSFSNLFSMICFLFLPLLLLLVLLPSLILYSQFSHFFSRFWFCFLCYVFSSFSSSSAFSVFKILSWTCLWVSFKDYWARRGGVSGSGGGGVIIEKERLKEKLNKKRSGNID